MTVVGHSPTPHTSLVGYVKGDDDLTTRSLSLTSSSIMDVGFVGLGAMGTPMAKNLHDAGLLTAVYNRMALDREHYRSESAFRPAGAGNQTHRNGLQYADTTYKQSIE